MELELGLLKLQEFVWKTRASVLGLQLTTEKLFEAGKALYKEEKLVHLCDVVFCRKKVSDDFCEILVLSNH